MKIPILIRFIVFCITLFPLYAYGNNIIKIDSNTLSIKSFKLDYAENTDSFSDIDKSTVWKTTDNKVQFKPKKNYWYKVTIQNSTSALQTRILFFTESNIEYIDLYPPQDSKYVKEASGATISPTQRPIDSHLIGFKITLQPYEKSTFYLHINSHIPSFEEIWLLSEQDFASYEKKSLVMYVAYFGILLTTMIYSLIITVTTKEKILVVNTLYLFFSLLWIMNNSGIGLYLFSSSVAWKLSCSVSISYILLIEFAKFFINLKEISINAYRSMVGLQWVLFLIAILTVIDASLGLSILIYVGLAALIFLIIGMIFFLFMPIKKIIKFYLIILFPLFISLIFYILASVNIIHPSYTYQYFYVFGSFIELNGFALLSLFYILNMRKTKEKQKQELDILRENYTHDLEKEIIKKTEELSYANEELEKNLQYQIALMQEIHHRVKNNLQMVISIISLEMMKSISEESNTILKNTIVRIQSISAIHEMLYGSSDITSISLSDYSHKLIQSVRSIYNDTDVKIYISCNQQNIGIRDAINLGLIIVELVSNSIKHNKNSTNLKIFVRINFAHSKLSLFIKDNGIGFDVHTIDLSKSIGINLIGSIAGSFNESKYDFHQRKGMLFALTCNFL